MKKIVSINRQQRLYIIPSGTGYSCLGFDVCRNRAVKLAAELGCSKPVMRRGTLAAYYEYVAMTKLAQERFEATGFRSATELTPELIGLEGKRVEVVHQWPKSGKVEKVRFLVGKSGGWIPCHLQIARRNCFGGYAVCLGKVQSVRVVS